MSVEVNKVRSEICKGRCINATNPLSGSPKEAKLCVTICDTDRGTLALAKDRTDNLNKKSHARPDVATGHSLVLTERVCC